MAGECYFADEESILGCHTMVRWRYAKLRDGQAHIEGVELPKICGDGFVLQMPAHLCGMKVVAVGQDYWRADDFPDFSAYNIYKVIIPEGVQKLAGVLFRGCGSIHEIVLPKSLRSIGSDVFSRCEAGVFTAASDVRYIGSWCLGAIDKTKDQYEIKEGIVGLAAEAFARCHNVKRVIFPNSLQHIGDRAFRDCDNLTSVCFPSALQSVGDEAFAGCLSMRFMDLPYASHLEELSLGENWNAASADEDSEGSFPDVDDAWHMSEEAVLSLKDEKMPFLLKVERPFDSRKRRLWRNVQNVQDSI